MICIFIPGRKDPQGPLDMRLLPDRSQDLGSQGERKISVPIESSLSSRFRSLIDARTSVVPPHIIYLVTAILYVSVSQTFFKWGPLLLARMFYGPPYSCSV
jgi:hypothetical protein